MTFTRSMIWASWTSFALTAAAFAQNAPPTTQEHDAHAPSTTRPTTRPIEPVGPIDGQSLNIPKLTALIGREGARLAKEGMLVPGMKLVGQLDRKQAKVTLPAGSGQTLSPAELYAQCREGVIVVGGVHLKPRPHSHDATGFIITADGVAVTNYHVMNNPEAPDFAGFVAMTPDGKVHPVKEVLAASEAFDIAIIKLDGENFKPIPIAPRAAVGSDSFCISHPTGQFWYFTRGMVASYTIGTRRPGQPVDTLEITTDYARGSSGGPILSSAGEVIGMVSSTNSIYYNTANNQQRDLQMVFHHCVTSAQILSLLENAKP